MTIVREIADALGALSEIVDNTRSIVKAVNDGREYLKRRYPDASDDFAELLRQMQVTVEGLAAATSVMSGFRFVIGSRRASERDLVRFNDYLIKQRAEVAELEGQIRRLKADCEKIRRLRDDLAARRNDGSWSSMFGLLGMRRSTRRDQLAASISNFYADDQTMIAEIERVLKISQNALADVDNSLGEPGHAYAFNVPRAADMLRVYSQMFQPSQQQLNELVDELRVAGAGLGAT